MTLLPFVSSYNPRNYGRQAKILFPLVVIFMALLSVIALARQPANSSASPELSVAGTVTDTYPGGEATYRIELLNHTDQIVYDGVISITLPSGFSYVPGST